MLTEFEQFLCLVEELPDPGSRGFLPGNRGDRIFAVRSQGEIFIYLNLCAHQRQPMELAKDRFLNAGKTAIMCYAHAAQFDIKTGECFQGVCAGAFLVPVPHRIEQGHIIIGRSLPSYRRD